MQINGVLIEDTFAEAFTMRAVRITITAADGYWAEQAAIAATGFATSVIGCGVEAGIEGVSPKTPDGRPGVDCLFFSTSEEDLESNMISRIGQAIMTAPTTACYAAPLTEFDPDDEKLSKNSSIGNKLRYFGDGYQASKLIADVRYWRIPVMDGEFLLQEEYTIAKAVGGGNFLIMAESEGPALSALRAAVEKMREIRGVILPFPGGAVRSGSKVGSRYKFMSASTNTAYCPSLRDKVEDSKLPDGVNVVMEIVVDGLTPELVGKAMEAGIREAVQVPGILGITAGNYGGKLGKHHFHLHQLLGGEAT